jgi:hypothetical protein
MVFLQLSLRPPWPCLLQRQLSSALEVPWLAQGACSRVASDSFSGMT